MVVQPQILTTLFFFIQQIFRIDDMSPELEREQKEISILAVNQVAKNFNQASILDLAFAYEIASKGQDQIFKHRFCKKVASKLAQVDAEAMPMLSLRCIINVLMLLGESGYAGRECLENVVQIANKHCDIDRLPFSLEELSGTFVFILDRQLDGHALLSSLIIDFVEAVHGEDFNEEYFFEFILIFYGLKIQNAEVYNHMIEAYISHGFDEDELVKLGNSTACKVLKAFSFLYPSMSDKNNVLFLRQCLEFIKSKYEEMTLMQLKRVKDFLLGMDYFKEDPEGTPEIQSLIKEVIDHYEKKSIQKTMSGGLTLEMTTGETILEHEDEEDTDPLFEDDISEDEDMNDLDESAKDKRFLKDLEYSGKPKVLIENLFQKNLSSSDIPKEDYPKVKLHSDFDDPKMKELTKMIDENYEKFGNMNKGRR